MSLSDLYSEIISATRTILNSEGFTDVDVRIKEGVFSTYFKPKKGDRFIQYGSENIREKLDLSYSSHRYEYLIYEHNKIYRFTPRFNTWLTAKERIACVIIEETAHVKAYSKGYRGKHGGYYKRTYLELFKKYFSKVLGMLPSVSKHEVVSMAEILGQSERMKVQMRETDKLIKGLGG